VNRSFSLRIFAAAVLVALTALSGCSNSPLAPEQSIAPTSAAGTSEANSSILGDAITTTTSTVVGTTSLVVSQTVGLLGGVVKCGDWTVTIPAGALSGIATVTVSVPDPTVPKVNLSVVPSLLNSFKVPVTLTCKLPTATDASTDVMYWWDPSAKVWRAIPSTANLTTYTRSAQLSHFSTYGCGKAGW